MTRSITVVILGAGRGGTALLKMLTSVPQVQILGIADQRAEAPGLAVAAARQIPISTDPLALIARPEADLIVDATGDPRMLGAILAHKRPEAQVLSGPAAQVLWAIASHLSWFQVAMDHANDAIVWIDFQGMIVWANRQAERLWARPLAHLVGHPFRDILSAESAARADARLEAIRQGEEVASLVEFEVVRPDGRTVPVEASIVTVQPAGQPAGRLIVARDLTERQRYERHLQQVDKLAALGTLLDGVAHELNNPLFAISGYAQLARERLDCAVYDGLPDDLAAIHEAAQRASAIVDRFLRVARTSGGHREVCHVPSLITRVLELVANDLRIHQIVVRTDEQPDLPHILADPQDLIQVLLNLTTNARQAMVSAHGKGMLTVTASVSHEPTGTWLDIRVRDDGPGISPEHQTRIFDPFFTTKPVGEGTGLGLSICHRIITTLGGTLTVESTLGQGATFIVRLPAHLDPLREA